jgi:RNA polymerase sigma-70 factor, ECF subfamily
MDDVAPDSADTHELLRRAHAGDREATERLLDRYRPFLHQVVALRLDPKVRPRVDPSDVVQETLLEAFRRLTDFLERHPMPFRIWLRRTALERMFNIRAHHVDAARRAVGQEVPIPERSSLLVAGRFLAADSTPSRQLSRRETVRRVNQALAGLGEADREILFMRDFEGLTYEEVAWALEIDPAAARKRYGRALLRLQKLLAEVGLLESSP